ncbi:hypothetical protein C9374_007739 [Naegleria lovaniensis]|uniref:ABC transporter domain-containing protein n=1 Tax=Naegleria lovaniensis TaxID=51637 RepID=A0AA88GMF7_NAELO|nr:uncharacterized protein C9374_007739 [Naegleria lovaniensis]KAG2379101.1 hypothetical protein C9374_007739 [Naegleria lovaniensis]
MLYQSGTTNIEVASSTPASFEANDDQHSRVDSIHGNNNNMQPYGFKQLEAKKVGCLSVTIAILLKTIAEERQRYCIWIFTIIVALNLTLIPSIMSIAFIIMNPEGGAVPIPFQTKTIGTYTIFEDVLKKYSYTSGSTCCSPPARSGDGSTILKCPNQDFNFAVRYDNIAFMNSFGYINYSATDQSTGIAKFVPHVCNRLDDQAPCKMTPLLLPNMDIQKIIDNQFKNIDSVQYPNVSLFSGVLNVRDVSEDSTSLKASLEMTSYTKTIYSTFYASLLNATNYYLMGSKISKSQMIRRLGISQFESSGTASTASFITFIVIPIALSLMLPVFIDVFSIDRKSGMMEFIELYGATYTHHYLVKTLFYYGIYAIYVVVQIVLGCAVKNEFFVGTNPAIYIFALLIWGITLIAIANVISLFKTDASYFIGYLLILFGLGGSIAVVLVFGASILPYYVMLVPSIALMRILFLMLCPTLIVQVEGSLDEQILIAFAFFIIMTALLVLVIPMYGLIRSILKRINRIIQTAKHRRNQTRKQHPTETTHILSNSSSPFNSFQNDSSSDLDKVADDTVLRELQLVESNLNIENHIVEVRHLVKRFGSKIAVKDVTFAISRGSCFGLLGSNGAGKTTSVECILGLAAPYEGTCTLSGMDISNIHSSILSSKIGFVQQFDKFFDITVLDQLKFFARIKGIPNKQLNAHIDEILQNVGLTEARRRKCKDLSGGMARRLSLAIAMLGDPELLILDELTKSLDPLTCDGIHMILKNYMNNKKKAILLLTHSMEEAEILCDKAAILVNGELKTIGTLHELKTKYGRGYKLNVQTLDASYNTIARDYIMNELVKEGLPLHSISHENSFGNKLEFRIHSSSESMVPSNKLTMEEAAIKSSSSKAILQSLFKIMSCAEARRAYIVDWTCNMASLEEVFIRKVRHQYEDVETH